MDIKILGIDLAKKVFQLHGVDEKSHAVLKKMVETFLLGYGLRSKNWSGSRLS